MVMEGVVAADSATVARPGTLVPEEAELSVAQPPPYVGRGGLKLAGALDEFQLEVTGAVVADIGASTGGFTDCLLQRGAARVYAIDVGYGQLDYRLRQDPRVVVMERVNARYHFELLEAVDLATIDVSFISLAKVLPSVSGLTRDRGYILALVKPQFEAERREVGKGGVVRDPQVHARVLGRFICRAVEQGLWVMGVTASPIRGGDGNREFFVLLRKPEG